MAFVTVNGVGVSYGPVKATNPFARFDMKSGDTSVRRLKINFTYDDLPVGGTGRNVSSGPIPANSMILDAFWQTKVPFVGGTSYDVGLEDAAGNGVAYRDSVAGTSTNSNKDELWDALLLANINVIGEASAASVHNGTNSGLLTVRSRAAAKTQGVIHINEDGYVVVTATGTFTAGEAVIIVEYIPPQD